MNIYTDGACKNNGKFNARSGIGIYIQETKEKISEPIENVYKELLPNLIDIKHTNNTAELLAILKAINISEINIKNKININICSDSMYSINCITKWYKSWEVNNWKTSQGKPVLNKEIIQEIIKYLKAYSNIKLIYTPAHKEKPTTNIERWYGNKIADELAVKSIL
jgi:ribonuclease HI